MRRSGSRSVTRHEVGWHWRTTEIPSRKLEVRSLLGQDRISCIWISEAKQKQQQIQSRSWRYNIENLYRSFRVLGLCLWGCDCWSFSWKVLSVGWGVFIFTSFFETRANFNEEDKQQTWFVTEDPIPGTLASLVLRVRATLDLNIKDSAPLWQDKEGLHLALLEVGVLQTFCLIHFVGAHFGSVRKRGWDIFITSWILVSHGNGG